MSGEESAPQMAPVESPHVVSYVKLHILKKGEYPLWSMRMEQYLTNTDYILWQVNMNGDEPMQTTKDENGVETEDAKTLWAAIKSRFGSNVESKKMQKNVLKQQFENFSISDTEGLDKAYDSINEVNTANGVSTASGHNSQGQASSSTYIDDLMFSLFANQSNSPQLDDEDLQQIDHDDLEEMDLKWQVAMLSMRVKRFYKKTKRKLIFNRKEPVGFDKTKLECFNCHRRGYFSRECRATRNQENMNGDERYRSRDNTRRTVPVETSVALVVQDNALIIQDGLGYD
ncbi:ribonuclease H-like domain-containing protein [Tanacetum coccineum]